MVADNKQECRRQKRKTPYNTGRGNQFFQNMVREIEKEKSFKNRRNKRGCYNKLRKLSLWQVGRGHKVQSIATRAEHQQDRITQQADTPVDERLPHNVS